MQRCCGGLLVGCSESKIGEMICTPKMCTSCAFMSSSLATCWLQNYVLKLCLGLNEISCGGYYLLSTHRPYNIPSLNVLVSWVSWFGFWISAGKGGHVIKIEMGTSWEQRALLVKQGGDFSCWDFPSLLNKLKISSPWRSSSSLRWEQSSPMHQLQMASLSREPPLTGGMRHHHHHHRCPWTRSQRVKDHLAVVVLEKR